MARRRVTVIDDSSQVLELFRDAFDELGADVTVFDGVVSTRAIVATEPDLLIVDLRLGTEGLPGWEIIRLARDDPALRDVPIVVCSAALDHVRQHEDEGNAIPGTYLLPKPFSVDDLDAVLRHALGADETGQAGRGRALADIG